MTIKITILRMKRPASFLLALCWLAGYTIGPSLHHPVVCAKALAEACGADCQSPLVSGFAVSGEAEDGTDSAGDGDPADDCPFCRILAAPYRVEAVAVYAVQSVMLPVRAAPWRLQTFCFRYNGFTFGARAPPSV